MIRILGYSAINKDVNGNGYVAQSTPLKSKQGEKNFAITTKLAESKDLARQLLVDDHLAVLNHYMYDVPGMPVSEWPESIVYKIVGSEKVLEAQNMMTKWGRPTLRTWDRPGSAYNL